jgi:hypothetical protein
MLTSLNSFSSESEDKLIVVVIGKLAKYISWNNASSDEFVITILNNPFDDLLDEIYKDRRIQKKKIQFKYISNIEELEDTHILYVSDVNYKELGKIYDNVKNKNILTISSSKGFAQKGGIVQIYFVSQKLKLKINSELAKVEQLKISSALLRISTIVKEVE